MSAARQTPGRFLHLGDFGPPSFVARPVMAYVPARLDIRAPHPTLYLLDGQNVFGDHGSYAGGWHAHDAADRLPRRSFLPPVIVAIGHGGVLRNRELGVQAPSFVEQVARVLVPEVEARLGGGGPRVIGGASLGGLASLVALIRHPEVFEGALAMSPSLWFGRRAVLRRLERGAWTLPPGARLYLDAGRRERGSMFADAEGLARLLAARGLGSRLMWRPDAKGAHHEKHWRRRLPKALRFLFAVAS